MDEEVAKTIGGGVSKEKPEEKSGILSFFK
jgi:hypothetical protein